MASRAARNGRQGDRVRGRRGRHRADQPPARGPHAPSTATTAATTLPKGYGPADLDSAYNLPSSGGTNQTVAVIDAGNDPNAEADLAVYRQTYGLPASTAASLTR